MAHDNSIVLHTWAALASPRSIVSCKPAYNCVLRFPLCLFMQSICTALLQNACKGIRIELQFKLFTHQQGLHDFSCILHLLLLCNVYFLYTHLLRSGITMDTAQP
ncbi:hypothetical protein VPH35_122665 [Triticum aestivum]